MGYKLVDQRLTTWSTSTVGQRVNAFLFYVQPNGAFGWREKDIKMEQIPLLIELIFLFLFKLI